MLLFMRVDLVLKEEANSLEFHMFIVREVYFFLVNDICIDLISCIPFDWAIEALGVIHFNQQQSRI